MHSTFSNWLADKLGTRNWVVAPRLTAGLQSRGYTLAISQPKFTDLRREFLDARAA